MLRLSLSVLVCIAMAAAMPFNGIEDVPEHYRELIPKEAKDFLTGLTDEDKAVLKDIAKNYNTYKSEDEALAALKAKSPALGEKAEKLHNLVKERVNGLGEEAKAFAKEIIAGARKMQASIVAGEKPKLEDIKEKAKTVIAKYKALSEEAKADLQKQFPILTSVIKNEKFQKIAGGFLGEAN